MEYITVSVAAAIMTYLSLGYLMAFVLISYGLRGVVGDLVHALTGAKKYITYGVFVIGFIIGVVWHIVFKEELMKLVVTYSVGTSLYELIIQAVINKLKSK